MPDRPIVYCGETYTVSQAHPAADALPWKLDTEEFAGIVKSMQADGFDDEKPIYRQAGSGLIISGRRRELAARVANVKPVYKDRDWNDLDIIQFVERDELNRRHLSASEKAASLVELTSLRKNGGSQSAISPTGTESPDSQVKTRGELAEKSGVGERTIRAAASVKDKSAGLFAAVKEGKIAAEEAEKLVKKATAKELETVLAATDIKASAKQVLKLKKAKKPVNPKSAAMPKAAPAPEPEADDPHDLIERLRKAVKADPDAAVPVADELRKLADKLTDDLPDTRTIDEKLVALCKQLDSIAADMDAWKDDPLSYTISFTTTQGGLRNVRTALWASRPNCQCPYCTGTGKHPRHGERCKGCKGTGLVTKTTEKSGMAAMGAA